MSIPPAAAHAAMTGTQFLCRVLPVFILGVLAAQLLIELGWLRAFARLARPLMRLGRLPDECAASFIATLLSPTAGHAMLAEYRQERRLGRLETVVASIVNNLPGEIAAGKSLLPLALPALGAFGALYYGLLLCAATIKAALMLCVGRFLLPPRVTAPQSPCIKSPKPALRTAWGNALRTSRRTLPRMLVVMIPTAYATTLLIESGAFERLSRHFDVLARHFPVSNAVLPVIAARLLSPLAAYTMAGGLLSSGAASGRDIVFALVSGALLSTGTNLRYLVPYYCGIFGPRTGAEIIGTSLLARTLSLTGVLIGMSILWR